jgi:thioredoxin-like negative regulator of GroEL
MKNDYALAAERVKQQLEGSWLAAVDATAQQGLQREHGVRGFPTLKLFRKGKFVADYDRARKADDLFAFMKNPPTGGSTDKDEL